MDQPDSMFWLSAMWESARGYRRMVDATVSQLSDTELFARPAPGTNSVAIILRHLGGNLRSRWTDFLTTDGEKPDRDRDLEFMEWVGDRQSLMNHFDLGWVALNHAFETIDQQNVTQTIFIRGEAHTITQALTRSLTHFTYHVGQILIIARMVHQGEWNWLTVAPGESTSHNERTWGTSASRSVFATDPDDREQSD